MNKKTIHYKSFRYLSRFKTLGFQFYFKIQRFKTLNNHFLSRQDIHCTTNTRVVYPVYTRPCVVFCPRLFSNNVALKRGKRKREREMLILKSLRSL